VSIVDPLWRVALVLIAGYLIGGVPFGVIVAKRFYGEDITKLGSGNTGATNVFRSLGWRPALAVAAADVSKGSVAALIAFALAGPQWPVYATDLLVIGAGLASMAGHMFSPYFGLRGGKGVATAAGAILVLMPAAFAALLVVFVGFLMLTKIVSVSSMVTALCFPLAIFLLYPGRGALFAFAALAVPLIFFAHRSNIGRLLRGEEPRVTMGRRPSRKGND
jgi:glycerol-3-phosphate acyltransferase PlsY